VGWAAATHQRAKLVPDALQMALWRRGRDGRPAGPGVTHHSDAGPQFVGRNDTAAPLALPVDCRSDFLFNPFAGYLNSSLKGPTRQARILALLACE
jgi:hypothetical protein